MEGTSNLQIVFEVVSRHRLCGKQDRPVYGGDVQRLQAALNRKLRSGNIGLAPNAP